jgi:hypothetical protein
MWKSAALSVARGSVLIHDDDLPIITFPTVNVCVLLADAMGRLIDSNVPFEAPRSHFRSSKSSKLSSDVMIMTCSITGNALRYGCNTCLKVFIAASNL